MTFNILQAALLLVPSVCIVSVTEAVSVQGRGSAPECAHVFKLEQGSSIELHVHNFTKSGDLNQYCTMQVTADRSTRIVLDLVYLPPPLTGSSPKVDCHSDYVHIGNDAGRVDVNLMTSYKFCGEDVRQELISKENHMWIVYKASQKPKQFAVRVRALQPVMCSMNEFSCSPVQCVDRSVICDGKKDCTNSQDEFCHRVDMIHNPVPMSEPCFRCGDGTCIQPRLSRYDISYGRVLWYLCDGFSHCPDAWDERQDICWRLPNGRVGSVTECVPFNLQFGHNGSVLMWNEIRCDANPDCFHGEDERNCYGRDTRGNKLRVDPATLGAVIGILVTACLIICVTYRLKVAMKHAARPSTSSTVDTKCTQCTAAETDHCHSATASHAPSDPPPVTVTLNDLSPDDDGSLDHDGDGSSFSSYNFKHTIV